LIPGMDDQGNVWRMDFFHAFYFVSFLGSTIGFGEIPYPFTDAQRLWTIISIYTAVVTWLYTIGVLLSVVQDPAFRELTGHNAFARAVQRLPGPFCLVCGYGDTGYLLVRELAEHGILCVVIDIRQARVNALAIEGLPVYVPGLCADASDPEALILAGLESPHCQCVIAITNSDPDNLKIAISSKLLRPTLPVICRADSHDTLANMASFGTDHIINPFDTFAEHFSHMFKSPSLSLVDNWITSMRGSALEDFIAPPQGSWVLCGYGRFGKALQKKLAEESVPLTIIEANPDNTDAPDGTVIGRGTEAVTLQEGNIESAVGVIAGTDDDTNNLSIVMTAQDLNPELFAVCRQNSHSNDSIYEAAQLDMVMQPSTMVARRIMTLILAPLLADFRRLAQAENEDWANILVSRISGLVTDSPPEVWTLKIRIGESPALVTWLEEGDTVTLAQLGNDPRQYTEQLPCLPLLLKRGIKYELLPEDDEPLAIGDEILYCGLAHAEDQMRWSARNLNVLNYVCTGVDRPTGAIWNWFSRKYGGGNHTGADADAG